MTSLPEGEVKTKARFVAIALILAFVASPALAQSAEMRADVEGAPAHVALSGWMHVVLVLEGPKPLRVELPAQLLTADADSIWRIQPAGAVQLVSVGNDREQWRRAYRLTPYPPPTGDTAGKRTASFNPATVNGRPVTWPPIIVEVTRSVGDLETTPPRAPVGVEDPPPPPVTPPPRVSVLQWVAFGVVVLLVLAVVVAQVLSRRPKPVPPHERALAALAQVLAANDLGAEAVDRVATILRKFVEGRFAIPATKLTTTELLAATREQGWPVEQTDPLHAILDECDRVKFAGDLADDDGCRRLVRLATDWVNNVSRPVGPG